MGCSLLYISEKSPRPNLKSFQYQYQIWKAVKILENSYQVKKILAIYWNSIALILG